MPAIQNQINLYVNANGQLVAGSEPINFLYRNNLNRNVFFIVTPLSQAAVVKLLFRNTSLSKQGYTGIAFITSSIGADITSDKVSYYELVKDWNVFKYIPSARILTKFPSTVTGSISLSVMINEPDLSDSSIYIYKGGIYNRDQQTMDFIYALKNNEYVTTKVSYLETVWGVLEFNDKLVKINNQITLIRTKWTSSTTEPLQFVGNPALEDTDFDDVEIGDTSLLNSVIAVQTEQAQAITELQEREPDEKSGKHIIVNEDNNIMPQRDNLQFVGAKLEDKEDINTTKATFISTEIFDEQDIELNINKELIIPTITLERRIGGKGSTNDVRCFARCDDTFVKFLEDGNRCQIWLYLRVRMSSGAAKYDNQRNKKFFVHPNDKSPDAPEKLFTRAQYNYGGDPRTNGWGIQAVNNAYKISRGGANHYDISHSQTGGYVPTEFEITKDNLIVLLDGTKAIIYDIPFTNFSDNCVVRNDDIHVRLLRTPTIYVGTCVRQFIKAEIVVKEHGKKRNGICKNQLVIHKYQDSILNREEIGGYII